MEYSKILDANTISHFDIATKKEITTSDFIKNKENATIMLTCGASCPDAVVEAILLKILTYFEDKLPMKSDFQIDASCLA